MSPDFQGFKCIAFSNGEINDTEPQRIFFILGIRDTLKNDLLIVATCYIDAEKLIYNSTIK